MSPGVAASGESPGTLSLEGTEEETPSGAVSLADVRLYRGRLGILGACCTVAFARSVDPRLWMMGLEIPEYAFGAGWQDYRVFTAVTGLLLIAGMLVGGLLGDVLGRRRMLLGGALVSTVCGALAMVAPNIPWFAATRVVDVAAGAMAFPLTLAVLRLTFPHRERPLALLILTVATGGGLLAGLLAILIEPVAGWRATLLLPTVAGAVGTHLVWRHVPESRAQEHVLIRAATAAAWALALLPLTLSASAARLTGTWGNPVTLTGLALAATGVALAGLLWRGRVRDLLPRNVVERKHHVLSVMLVTGAALNFGFTGYALQLYGFFTVVQGYSGILGGLALLPLGGSLPIAGRRAARMALLSDPRKLIAGGLGLMGIATVVTAWLRPGMPYPLLVPVMALFGFGFLVAQAAWSASFMSAMPDAVVGASAGIIRATAAAGAALGLALLGAVLVLTGEADFVRRLDALGLSPEQIGSALDGLNAALRADGIYGRYRPPPTMLELGLLALYNESYTVAVAFALRIAGGACLVMAGLAWFALEPRDTTNKNLDKQMQTS